MTSVVEHPLSDQSGISEVWILDWDQAYAIGFERGFEMGQQETYRKIIMNLFDMHKPVNFIARAVGKTPEYVESVIEQVAVKGNDVKLSEICNDSFRDEVSQVAQDSGVSQVSRMR